jgi:hypothetical protein
MMGAASPRVWDRRSRSLRRDGRSRAGFVGYGAAFTNSSIWLRQAEPSWPSSEQAGLQANQLHKSKNLRLLVLYHFMWFLGLLNLNKAFSLRGNLSLPLCGEGAGCHCGLNISPSGRGNALARGLCQRRNRPGLTKPPRRRQAAPS